MQFISPGSLGRSMWSSRCLTSSYPHPFISLRLSSFHVLFHLFGAGRKIFFWGDNLVRRDDRLFLTKRIVLSVNANMFTLVFVSDLVPNPIIFLFNVMVLKWQTRFPGPTLWGHWWCYKISTTEQSSVGDCDAYLLHGRRNCRLYPIHPQIALASLSFCLH